jgi:hypothetical protein
LFTAVVILLGLAKSHHGTLFLMAELKYQFFFTAILVILQPFKIKINTQLGHC